MYLMRMSISRNFQSLLGIIVDPFRPPIFFQDNHFIAKSLAFIAIHAIAMVFGIADWPALLNHRGSLFFTRGKKDPNFNLSLLIN
jgi:hypothetical protein